VTSVLDTILDEKKREAAELKRNRSLFSDMPTPPPRRDFAKAIAGTDKLSIIAEVKKASPSKGIIRSDFNAVTIAQNYFRAGADAVSVLTDVKYFMGAPQYLVEVRNAISLPVLRKDFIIDTIQVEQTAALGADAMLLIVAALDDHQLYDLQQAASALAIATLIEVHNHAELDRALKIAPQSIGINNRNLSTFVTDLQVTIDLMRYIPGTTVAVSESGISKREHAEMVKSAGVRALLVGESLMREDDPSVLLNDLKV